MRGHRMKSQYLEQHMVCLALSLCYLTPRSGLGVTHPAETNVIYKGAIQAGQIHTCTHSSHQRKWLIRPVNLSG